jgi:predicted  nucleic acid-binding Zn-ribbon protein
LEEENNYNLSKIEKLESEIVQLEGIIKSKNDELDIIKSNLNWYKDENEKIINWYKNEIEKINKWHEAHYKKLPLPIIKIAKYLNKKTNA